MPTISWVLQDLHLGSIAVACFAPSWRPINTWFYWSFDRPKQMLLSIYFYLFHIREKEENHFLMSADSFSVWVLLLHFERGNITGWKYTQKHVLGPYMMSSTGLNVFNWDVQCVAGERQLIFSMWMPSFPREAKGKFNIQLQTLTGKGNHSLTSFFWVWETFWSRI